MLPSSGWLGESSGAPITPVPIPEPFVATYGDGDTLAPLTPLSEPPSFDVRSMGNAGVEVEGWVAATGERGFEASLVVEDAYAVVLLDRLTLPPISWEQCGRPVTGVYAQRTRPENGGWTQCAPVP